MEEIDLEKGLGEEIDEEMEEALAQFRKETEALSQAIDRINGNIATIEVQYDISLNEEASEAEKQVASSDISRLLEQTEVTSGAIRKRLRRIAGENKKFANENPGKVGGLRMRVNSHQGLTKRFMAAMQAFEASQEAHRDHVRGALERQLRKMNPNATQGDIEEALRRGDTDKVVDESVMLTELPLQEQLRLRNGLADLQSRNNDIKKIEESIIQLHQLLVDMQILVDTQGELLNNIEYNVEETKGKTQAGLQELVEAREHQKSVTKKKVCIFILIIVLALVILIPILVKFIPIWFPQTQEVISNIPIIGGAFNNSTNASSGKQAPV